MLHRFAIDASTIFVARGDGALWSLEPAYYDVSVVLPPANRYVVGRPAWLAIGGVRAPVAVDLDLEANHLPYLLEAHYAAENDNAVPADRLLIEHAASQAVSFLRRAVTASR